MQTWQTALVVAGSVAGATLIAWPIASWLQVKVLEKPRYTTIRYLGSTRRVRAGLSLTSASLDSWWTGKASAELRQYAPYLVAEVEVKEPSMRLALNKGFRQVAGYIFGGNKGVVSSVSQKEGVSEKGQSISMTSPVAADLGTDGSYRVAFMMPSKYTKDNLPQPNNPNVTIKEVPSRTLAALVFSGSIPNEDVVVAKRKELEALLRAEGLEGEGNTMLWQYHPPFAPSFIRRNEVLLAVKETL